MRTGGGLFASASLPSLGDSLRRALKTAETTEIQTEGGRQGREEEERRKKKRR